MAEMGLCTSAAGPVEIGQLRAEQLDPEDPRCARVTFSGRFREVTDPVELATAKAFLFARHPAMASWPTDHDWAVHEIDIAEIWLIDIYGGGGPFTYTFIQTCSRICISTSIMLVSRGEWIQRYSTCACMRACVCTGSRSRE